MSKKDLPQLQQWTKARVTLGLRGHSIPMYEILKFNHARANARDAVHAHWDMNTITSHNKSAVIVSSQVHDRAEFLKRPDLGRKLREDSKATLCGLKNNYDIVFIVSDGLSATAVDKNFQPLWSAIQNVFANSHLTIAPLILAPFARVALSDDIGQCLNAKIAVIFIGERPGLTAPDSLGIYLTYNPKPGNTDSNRNCISNIRPPDGLSYDQAAAKLFYLITESLKLKLSGTALKETLPNDNLLNL